MPALQVRQSRIQSDDLTLIPLRIVGIVIVVVVILFVIGLIVWRRHQRKRRNAESSRRARHLVKKSFPRPAPDPSLPPYEPPRYDLALQNGGVINGSGATTPPLTFPPPVRLTTPPGYGAHIADRPAGPLTDAPPAYQERDRETWGRSGCIR